MKYIRFFVWIKRQKGRHDFIGDLARDVFSDEGGGESKLRNTKAVRLLKMLGTNIKVIN